MSKLKRRPDETDEQYAARVEESVELDKARQKAYYEANKERLKARRDEIGERKAHAEIMAAHRCVRCDSCGYSWRATALRR